MIEGKAENLEEWYQILQESVDKYNVLISNLILPQQPQEPEETENLDYTRELSEYKKKHEKYLEAQKPYKYYLELKN